MKENREVLDEQEVKENFIKADKFPKLFRIDTWIKHILIWIVGFLLTLYLTFVLFYPKLVNQEIILELLKNSRRSVEVILIITIGTVIVKLARIFK